MRGEKADMTKTSVTSAFIGVLLMASALTPARAADMTNERALNPQREPQNWILHHGNYQGHRFSLLKEINTETVRNLKPAFTVALGGFQSGGRYAFGNLEATPLVEDGIMYVPDGWGSVYAIDVSAGKKGVIKWKMDPGTDRAWAGDVACCGVNNRGVALWKDKVISIALDGRMFAINKATGELAWERKIADPAIGETITMAPLVIRDLAIVGTAGGEFGIRGFIEATDLNTGKAAWRTYTIPGAGEPGNETWKDGRERWKHGFGLGDRDLRPGKRYLLSGHRQCRPRLGRRISPWRQQVGRERAGAQPERRQDQVGLPIYPQRSLRLRRNLRAPDHQRQGQRRGPQARGPCRAQWLLLHA
jgi:alcohol dehydrogenase (cytochrome c)